MAEHEKIEIDDDTRKFIIDKLVEPYYKSIVANTISGKTCWRRTGITFETLSKVMVALGSIMSFSSGYFHDDTLSFISGSISCLSLACLQFASFSYKENKKQGDELNILLKKLKLDTVPALARDDYISARAQIQTQSRSYAPDQYNQQQQRLREESLMREIERLNQEREALFTEIYNHAPVVQAHVNQGDNNSVRSYKKSVDTTVQQDVLQASTTSMI